MVHIERCVGLTMRIVTSPERMAKLRWHVRRTTGASWQEPWVLSAHREERRIQSAIGARRPDIILYEVSERRDMLLPYRAFRPDGELTGMSINCFLFIRFTSSIADFTLG